MGGACGAPHLLGIYFISKMHTKTIQKIQKAYIKTYEKDVKIYKDIENSQGTLLLQKCRPLYIICKMLLKTQIAWNVVTRRVVAMCTNDQAKRVSYSFCGQQVMRAMRYMLWCSSLSGNESYTNAGTAIHLSDRSRCSLAPWAKTQQHGKNAIEMLYKVIKLETSLLYTKGAVVFV